MGIIGQFKINTNQEDCRISQVFFIGRLLGWELKSDCCKLHSIGHYKPTNLRAVWSKSENITKRMEAHFTCVTETCQLWWLVNLGTKQKGFIPMHFGRSREIWWLYISACFFQFQHLIRNHRARFLEHWHDHMNGHLNSIQVQNQCFGTSDDKTTQNFSIVTQAEQEPSPTGASVLSWSFLVYGYQLPSGSAVTSPHHVLQYSKDLLSGLSKSHIDVWLPKLPGFMLNWRDKFPRVCCPPRAAASHRWILFAAPSCGKVGACRL